MIAKTTTGSSFDSALGYGAADLTENQRQRKQAQVVLLDCYNLINSEWRGMAAEMSAVAQGSRCQTPVWHTSLSVGAGESLSSEQWRAAAREYCVSMGADPQQHQVAIFQHQDTAHPHVHIYINRVRLDDGPALHTGHNYARNVKATRHIEQSLALAPLPDQRTSLKDHSPAIQANRQQLATLVGQVLSQTKPGTFAELAADLAEQGVQLQVVTNAKGGYGVSFKTGDNPPAKGSAIGYKYRHLQHQLDANRAEYQAEIERLKKALEEAENKPAEMVEVEKVVEIIKQVEVVKEVEVIKRDPADVAEIERLIEREADLLDIATTNYTAWEKEKARADEAENKLANAAAAVKAAPAIPQAEVTSGPVAELATGVAARPTPGLVKKLGHSLSAWSQKLSGSGAVARLTDIGEAISRRVSGAVVEGYTKLGELTDQLAANRLAYIAEEADRRQRIDHALKLYGEAGIRLTYGEAERIEGGEKLRVPGTDRYMWHEDGAYFLTPDPAAVEPVVVVTPAQTSAKVADTSPLTLSERVVKEFGVKPSERALAILSAGNKVGYSNIGKTIWLQDGQLKSHPHQTLTIPQKPATTTDAQKSATIPTNAPATSNPGLPGQKATKKAADVPKLTLKEQYVKLFGYPPLENTRTKLEAGMVLNNIKDGKTIWVKDGLLNFRPYTPEQAISTLSSTPVKTNPPEAAKLAPSGTKPAVASSSQKLTPLTQQQSETPVKKPGQTALQADNSPESAPAWHEDLRQKLSKTKNTASLQYNGYEIGRTRSGEERFRPHSSRDSSDWITAKELGGKTLQKGQQQRW